MNVLKNVLFFGLLIVVLCLVTYVLTNKQPEKPLPAGLVNDTAPVKVELPNPLGTPASNPVPDSGGNTPALPATPPAMGIPPAVPSGGMARRTSRRRVPHRMLRLVGWWDKIWSGFVTDLA